MVKRLSFVRRAPDVPAEEFGRLWRQQGEDAVASAPADIAPTRLAHCVVRPARHRAAYDGVAIAWFEEPAQVGRYDGWLTKHRPKQRSLLDETVTANVLVDERTVSGEAWLDKRWSDPDAAPALVLIGCIEATEGLSRQGFRAYWWDQHRPLANQLVPDHLEPVAYVHDYVLPGEPTRWSGVGEMYEQSLDVARQRGQWFESGAALPLVADEERFLCRATRQVLVTDQELISRA
jgi:hypothetical protein